MTLIQLEYIIAVDTYKSFVLAAEKSFVTQPTLSMQIQKLEKSLGVRIFDRSKQPIVATDIGAVIINQARSVLKERDKIKELISETQDELGGEIKIGVIPTLAPYLLPKILGSFMEKYPKMKLQIWESTTTKVISELKLGLLDCGILSTPLNDGELIETPLFYESFVAYISENSSLNKSKTVSATELLNEKLWLLNEGHCMRNQVLNICQKKRALNPEQTLEYNTGSVETLKRMVDMNSGVTILPELSILDFNEDELEHVRYFISPEPVREISLVTTQNFLKKKAISFLTKEILEAVPEKFKSSKRKELMSID
ncbi:hydrogen peroxide-inducible genes activator [Albibacterium indicum]|uniref:hydrogen peroxide-inducible genes activator n=1 Tax=Albibacterium indicum TaxID=2292082 RepID=UPI000E4F5B1E|nr:hydrogen peroxide-inducible genes activator [Pedobacter indicus]